MPYTRRRSRFTRRPTSRPYRRRRPAASVKRQVVKYINKTREHKFFINDLAVGHVDSGAPDIWGGLCEVPQGVTVNDRDGRQITPSSLRFTYRVAAQQTAGPPAPPAQETVRCMLFIWKCNDTTPPQVSDILELGSTAALAVWSPYKQKPTNHFTILHDKTYTLAQSQGYTKALNRTVRLFGRRLKRITFDGLGSIRGSNKIYFMILSTNPNPGADGSFYSYVSTFRFTDS